MTAWPEHAGLACASIRETMPGRKRKLEQASEENLALCLQAAPHVADASVTTIWSMARGESVGSAHVQQRRLEDAKKCFQSHSLKATQGPDVKVWVADLPQLLRHTVTRCPSWAEALEAALNATSDETLTAVLYHDELVCGNILAPRQSKKICLLYLSFREMRIHLHKEAAWLTIACLQRMAIKDVEGGMSLIMATICKEVHKQTHLDGFPLPLPSGPRKFALRARSLFLSDHDAQRATWGVKGSAGIKPCMHCCNILNNGSEIFEPFRPLSESDCSKFIPFKDEEYFQCADELGRIRRVGERAERQTVLGFNHIPGGMLLEPHCRAHLPPSASCADAFHCYYSNGVASWECGLLQHELQKRGITLQALKKAACQDTWHQPGRDNGAATIRALLHDNLFDGKTFRGSAKECAKVIFLLQYYAQALLRGHADCQPALRSFTLLREVASEMRRLQHLWTGIRQASDVSRFRALQTSHQEAFAAAYTAEAMKPKHHHRMHLPDACLKLGILPSTEVHESKHRQVKSSGCMDRQKKATNQSENMQRGLLPRLLDSNLRLANEYGLGAWEPMRGPTQPAAPQLRRALEDGSLRSCKKGLCLLQSQIHVGDVAFWGDAGGIVTECLSGKAAGLAVLADELRKLSDMPYGSIWQRTGGTAINKLTLQSSLLLPSWWRFQGDKIVCLH